MFAQGRILLCLAMAVSMAWVGGCQADSKVQAGPQVRLDQVPLVRPFPLVAMDEPMVLEFTLPPPGKSASSTLFLGIRVRGDDGLKSLDAGREVRNLGLPAELKLERLEGQKSTMVPLVRVESAAGTPARIEPIGPTGRVAGGWLENVDHQALQSAGLQPAGSYYTQVAFAWAQGQTPGRYRLSIRLLQPDGRLSSTPSELLVAYVNKSK
ncbi:hypothetical protein [Stenotrophomonas sp.]|uniref:hypothetical protein n=1 Tax=Stenotrophomonas sp. TaxID=69392 RepID=UPI0028AF7F86|nr:hypothetical protein [Stenotrophomonas sp.]